MFKIKQCIMLTLCIVLNFQYTRVTISIKNNLFRLTEAQVVPLHKKNDPLDKKNYRPVSILPTISKVYEMVLSDQLTDLFECTT
jgi:hypothetical protein